MHGSLRWLLTYSRVHKEIVTINLMEKEYPPLAPVSPGADTGFRKGGSGKLLSTKMQCFLAHAHDVFFPLYEVWGFSKRGDSDP